MATDKPPRFRCPKCAKLLNVPERLAGKRGKCPACKTVITFLKEPAPKELAAPPPVQAEPQTAPQQQLPGEASRWRTVCGGLKLIYLGQLTLAVNLIPLILAQLLYQAAPDMGLSQLLVGLTVAAHVVGWILTAIGDWMTTRAPTQTGLALWAYASAGSLSAAPVLMMMMAIVIEAISGRGAGAVPVHAFNLACLVRSITFVLFLRGLAETMGNIEHTAEVKRFAKFWIGLLPGLFVFAAVVRFILWMFGVDDLWTLTCSMGLIWLGGGGYLVFVLIRWLLRLISDSRDMILADVGAGQISDHDALKFAEERRDPPAAAAESTNLADAGAPAADLAFGPPTIDTAAKQSPTRKRTLVVLGACGGGVLLIVILAVAYAFLMRAEQRRLQPWLDAHVHNADLIEESLHQNDQSLVALQQGNIGLSRVHLENANRLRRDHLERRREIIVAVARQLNGGKLEGLSASQINRVTGLLNGALTRKRGSISGNLVISEAEARAAVGTQR